MAILEVLQLRIKPALSPTDSSILKSLQSVRRKLKDSGSDTQSRFYQCTHEPTIIHVLGIWPTLAAHQAFLSSPAKPSILRDQEDCLDFAWVLHVEIDAMSSLPLDAPFMAIQRMWVKGGEHVREYERLMRTMVEGIREATEPYGVVVGWRCDSEEGQQESVLFTAFEPSSHAIADRAGVGRPEWDKIMDHLEDTETSYGRDMER